MNQIRSTYIQMMEYKKLNDNAIEFVDLLTETHSDERIDLDHAMNLPFVKVSDEKAIPKQYLK